MANKTYQDFLSRVRPEMLDANGRFLGPQAGLNYQAEGLTPQEFYARQMSMVGDPNARDGADAGQHQFGDASLDWRPGPIGTGDMWSVPLMMLAAPYAASQLGLTGAADTGVGAAGEVAAGDGFGIDAVSSAAPNAGMSLADQYASYGAGGGGVTGGISGGAGGTFTGLAGGDAIPGTGGGLLDSVGNWIKDNPTLTKLAGGAIGALASGNSKTSASATKDPWAPAQPYLLQNLADNQKAADYYRANPFSDEQKAQFQGLLNTVAQSQAGGQGLLANAANFMKSNRGVMPAMTAAPTNVTAPTINWSQYANIGRK